MNLVGGEAVEESVSTRAHQIFLAAASASVRRIPRSGMLAPTGPIVMPCPGAALAVARPVIAGRVLVPRESGAVELRTRQNIVPIGLVTGTINDVTILIHRDRLSDIVAIFMQPVDVPSDIGTGRVIPRPIAYTVARIDERRAHTRCLT